MMAQILPFPAERIHRHPDLIDALEKLEMCDEYEVSDNPAKRAVVGTMRRYWEEELVRLGGVPKHLLQRDAPDREDA